MKNKRSYAYLLCGALVLSMGSSNLNAVSWKEKWGVFKKKVKHGAEQAAALLGKAAQLAKQADAFAEQAYELAEETNNNLKSELAELEKKRKLEQLGEEEYEQEKKRLKALIGHIDNVRKKIGVAQTAFDIVSEVQKAVTPKRPAPGILMSPTKTLTPAVIPPAIPKTPSKVPIAQPMEPPMESVVIPTAPPETPAPGETVPRAAEPKPKLVRPTTAQLEAVRLKPAKRKPKTAPPATELGGLVDLLERSEEFQERMKEQRRAVAPPAEEGWGE